MTAGLRRSDTQYIWPENLVRPADVRLIYLDLNHWVSLAKAAVGHPGGRAHLGALEEFRRAKASGGVAFPLSSTHFMEISGITNRRHRVDVANVMEELSGFVVVISRSVLMQLEIETALDSFRRRAVPYAPVPLVGRGVLRAFGMVGGLRIRDESGEDVTAQVRAESPIGPEGFDARIEEYERMLDRSVLRGPTAEEEPSLRAEGWDPTVARRIASRRADEERAQAERFAEHPLYWRKHRVRDVVSGRHMFIELNERMSEGLTARGLELEDVCHDPETARRFVDSMPSSDVCVTLTAAAHRNPQTRWNRNRIFDIDALSVAVPYCDFIATDREATHALHAEGVPTRLQTAVVATLDEIAETLL